MTDTITTEVVDTTITNLQEALAKAEVRLGTEATEYEAKRDRMVAVAHARGTSNSIGPALDDLLEEFGLPRRGEAVTMHGLIMVSAALDVSQTSGFYAGPSANPSYVYSQPGTRVSWPIPLEFLTNVKEGDTCACENAEQTVREYMSSYFGAARAREMTFQIGALNCGASAGCVNGERRRFDVSRDYGIDWTTKPVLVHTQPEPTPVDPAASVDPQEGETWFMVGAYTNGASNTDGEPVVINRVEGGTYYVRRLNDREGSSRWTFRREHLRQTPSA